MIFPTINSTELEVWESKYYPYNVLEQKMSDYLASLYKTSPRIDARVLDEAAMNRWLSGSRRGDDMAVQLELYSAIMKDKHVIGTSTSGRVLVRIRVFDRAKVKEIAVRNVRGKSARFTLDSDEDIFWFDAAVAGLGIPFENGIDFFGLTNSKYKGQEMSRPTWDQFRAVNQERNRSGSTSITRTNPQRHQKQRAYSSFDGARYFSGHIRYNRENTRSDSGLETTQTRLHYFTRKVC